MAPKETPLGEEHRRLGARMVEFGGYLMPQQYTSIRDEHLAVREAAGLFDLSHMGRLWLPLDARSRLQRVLTNDLDRIQPGEAQYTLLCNDSGGIIDDLVVYWLPGGFQLVVNASTHAKDVAWLQPHVGQLDDMTDTVALLALQGPRAAELLPTGADLDQLPYFGVAEMDVCGVDCTVSRTGYTGEDGFEIFVAAERAAEVWRGLLASGGGGQVLPCGLGARDVCRLEAGLRLYGSDMDESTNPYEAGLGWTVRLQKEDFVGREALTAVKAAGPARETKGVQTEGNVIPRHGTRVTQAGEDIGEVTSGTYSFFLHRGVGMLRVKRGTVGAGEMLTLVTRSGDAAGEVVELPFYRGTVKMPSAAKSSS